MSAIPSSDKLMLQVFYDRTLGLSAQKGSDVIDVYKSANLKQIVEILNKRLVPLGIKAINYADVELVIHETTSQRLVKIQDRESLISANIVVRADKFNTATLRKRNSQQAACTIL
ncbi:hypothetical protein EV183_005240 [Coemansia sp. RSA 2336]|nr:hypothetical protein EV183_005240 [Coemansia sp. RSA 2336]